MIFAAAASAACGHKIGDSCSISSDCSPTGDRICDTSSKPGGYCTIQGCDFDTCPGEATCVRFFPASDLTKSCTMPTDCSLDEVCTNGRCALRSTEVRYCMLKCGGHGDCRGGYECRNEERQIAHGGEPVPDPATGTPNTQPFCAQAKGCALDSDCDLGDTCDVTRKPPSCTPGSF